MSACVVLAWSVILLILAALGSMGPARPAQANTSIASYPRATLASESVAVTTAHPAAPAGRARPGPCWRHPSVAEGRTAGSRTARGDRVRHRTRRGLRPPSV